MPTDQPSLMRFVVEPDPAWDWSEEPDGVLTVELSWKPDALAGRLEEIVASPALIEALRDAGFAGFETAPARGYFGEDSFEDDESTPVPELIRLKVSSDQTADLYYEPRIGLVVTEQVLTVLRAHCTRMTVAALT